MLREQIKNLNWLNTLYKKKATQYNRMSRKCKNLPQKIERRARNKTQSENWSRNSDWHFQIKIFGICLSLKHVQSSFLQTLLWEHATVSDRGANRSPNWRDLETQEKRVKAPDLFTNTNH